MTDYMAQMLDELMGPSRNAVAGDPKMTYDHRDICKNFLAGFCPNELFRNTKADLGICSLRHDERLKLEYQNSSRYGKLGYEEHFIERIRALDREVKRRIEKNMQRLESDLKGYANEANNTKQADDAKVKEMTEQIEENLVEAQKLCESGNVTAGEALIKQAEVLEQQRNFLMIDKQEQQRRIEMTAQELNKPMHVCQVCGCFMLINDAQSRIDDHLMGKMHLTYGRIRQTIEEWDQKKEEERKKQQEEREKRHHEKKSRDKDEKKDKDDRKAKRKSRSRSRSRKRSHSRERRDSRTHRSKDHHHSDRDRRHHNRKHD